MRKAESYSGCIVVAIGALLVVAATALFGCADAPAPVNPNAGLLRDFLDGKFDGAGHPLNGKVIDAAGACAGAAHDDSVVLDGACDLALPDGARSSGLVVNAHLQVLAHGDDVATLALLDASGAAVTSETLTSARLRDDGWIDLSVRATQSVATVRVTPAAGAKLALAYVEAFPERFGLVIAPGSGVIADTDRLTFELPLHAMVDKVEVDGAAASLAAAHQQTTDFRTLIDIGVADLAPMRGDVAELQVRAGGAAARAQLRRTAAACEFAGDPAGTKVLVTGFQPFPADGWHDNVSGVAVTALDPSVLHGARVMKLILPVEYDRAAALVTDAIARCAPDVVISFGQGGGEIALEHVAYNLQDTGEIAGGVPDNRGIIRAAQPIDPAAPATRDTLLPLDAIHDALVALGESPQPSTDPGRYICNNVMFADIGAMTGHGRAGFIHLPYTSEFDDAVRARFAAVVAAAIQATVDTRD